MKKLLPVVSAALLLAAGAAVWFWRSAQEAEPKNELVLHGNVDIRQVDLAFNGNERIAEMVAAEGAAVKKGQIVARLETDRLRPEVERAKAQLEAQGQVLAALEAGTRPEEIRKSRAEVEAARVEAENAERNYRRLVPLARQNLASKEQLDNARTAAENSHARLDAARQALDLALAGPRVEEVKAARARLRAFQAELALARRRLWDAELRAPEDGVIRDRLLEPGDMASPQRPVYTLALTDPLWVRVYVSEPDLGKVRPGMPARVTTDSFPDHSYRGWVGFISPISEFTPKSVETTEVRTSLVYEARVFVCNPEGDLRLGMPATVSISLDSPSPPLSEGEDPCRRPP